MTQGYADRPNQLSLVCLPFPNIFGSPEGFSINLLRNLIAPATSIACVAIVAVRLLPSPAGAPTQIFESRPQNNEVCLSKTTDKESSKASISPKYKKLAPCTRYEMPTDSRVCWDLGCKSFFRYIQDIDRHLIRFFYVRCSYIHICIYVYVKKLGNS